MPHRIALAATVLATLLATTACRDAPTSPTPAARPSLSATRYQDNYRFTVEYTQRAWCANGGHGEDVLVRLDGHNVILSVAAEGGNVVLHDFGQMHGSAVGLTTGAVYRLGSVYQQTETGVGDDPRFANTVTYVARLVDPGSGIELLYRSTIHATRDASGELTVYFERESVECR